jgi:hypothetical protein
MTNPLPSTSEEIATFIAAFEDCSLPKERWTHGAHILGGAWYVHQLDEATALDHMRLCVKRYNLAVGGENTASAGYHETATVFWIKLLHAFLQNNGSLDRAEFADTAVAHFAADRHIYSRYYDFDIIASTEARARWISPNLQPILPRSISGEV